MTHDTYNKEKINRLKYKFADCEKIDHNYSQAYQDMFVLSILDGKRNGTFVEIGTWHPTDISNTYLLEQQYGWSGVSVDINDIPNYSTVRSSKLVIQDALKINYLELFEGHKLPKHIDYLQLDIEPPENTLAVLKLIPFDDYTFSVITFETDAYYAGDDITKISRKILLDNGYMLIAGDVCNADPSKPFEDWYVNPKFVSENLIKLFKSDDSSIAERIVIY